MEKINSINLDSNNLKELKENEELIDSNINDLEEEDTLPTMDSLIENELSRNMAVGFVDDCVNNLRDDLGDNSFNDGVREGISLLKTGLEKAKIGEFKNYADFSMNNFKNNSEINDQMKIMFERLKNQEGKMTIDIFLDTILGDLKNDPRCVSFKTTIKSKVADFGLTDEEINFKDYSKDIKSIYFGEK